MADELTEGWVSMINYDEWHYIRDGRSLCGHIMYLGNRFEQGYDDSPYNCPACRKKLMKEREKAGGGK